MNSCRLLEHDTLLITISGKPFCLNDKPTVVRAVIDVEDVSDVIAGSVF